MPLVAISRPFRAGAQGVAVAVMAKAPRAGAAKTRLSPPLRPAEAARLGVCFLRDITATLAGVPAIIPFVAYAPAESAAQIAGMVAAGTRLLLADGRGAAAEGVAGFGLCLWQAADALASMGFAALCLVSADAPTLPAAIVSAAARALSQPGEPVLLGPAADGGYYLIGMKIPHPRLFAEIAWSGADVAATTTTRAREIGREVRLLPPWYDVDDAAGLARLAAALESGRERAPNTRACLVRLGVIAGAAA